MLVGLKQGQPKIGEGAFIAPTATLIGDVAVGEKSSIWFGVVVRGDVMPIRIGRESNIQDNTVIHGTYKKCGTTIGDRVTVGHGVLLHGCTVGDRVLVGMGSILMDGVEIGADSIVAAGALVTEGKKFPPGVLIVGRPAVIKRELTSEERTFLNQSADNYLFYKTWYDEMTLTESQPKENP